MINGMMFKDMIVYLIFVCVLIIFIFLLFLFWNIGFDIYEGNIVISLICLINYCY